MRCVLRARVKWNGGLGSNAKLIEKLIEEHEEYYQSADQYLSASDLDPVEKYRQQRILRRMRWRGVDLVEGAACR